MNRKEFLQILQEPTQLQNNQVFELEDIIKSFPYFQAARVLHLKGLKIQDSFRYNQSLKTTAIHTTDRSVLFHFITSDVFHESQSIKEEQKFIEEIESVDKNVLKNIKKEEFTETDDNDISKTIEIDSIEGQDDDVEEKSYEEIESDLIPTDPTLDTTNKRIDEILITEKEIEEFEDEDNDGLLEEIAINVFEENNINESTDIEDVIITEISTEEEEEEEMVKDFSFEIDTNDQIQTIKTNLEKDISIKTTNDFTFNFEPVIENGDINLGKKETSSVKNENLSFDLDVEEPIHFKKDDTHSFSEWMQLSSFKPIDRSNTTNSTSKQENKMDIIDEFIENNPKISPIKKTDFTVSFSQVKEVESDAVMTETLARVYTEQQKYGSAIKAYEVLSLKFPEKSSFFADQIKKLKELKKTN